MSDAAPVPAPDAADLPKPFLDASGTLVVPAGCDPRYRWWAKGGLHIADILKELMAPKSVWARYSPDPYPEDLAREVYPLLGG